MAITIRTEINLTARFVLSTEAQASFVGEDRGCDCRGNYTCMGCSS